MLRPQLYEHPFYPNYRFSKDGRVWTKFQRADWEPLKPLKTNKNYFRVDLKDKEGKLKHRSVHRVIAEVFIPNPNNYPCINHKDENRQNNAIENLEWCSYQYNNLYGHRIEKAMPAFIKAAEDRCKPVVATDKDGNILYFKSMTDAAKNIGRGKSTIARHVISGRPCSGYILKLAEGKQIYAG